MLDERFAECVVAAFSEQFPVVGVVQSDERCDLELQQVALVGVEIHCMDSAGTFEEIVEDVVSSRGDCEDDVRFLNI